MTYRQIFDDAIGPNPPAAVDVDRVIQRERRAARRRPLLAGITVLAVAAGSALALDAGGNEPTEPTEPTRFFPSYVEGARVIAESSAPLSAGELTLDFIPDSVGGLLILVRCEADPGHDLDLALGIGGGTLDLTDLCGETDQTVVRPSPGWAPWSQAGEPSRIVLSITGPPDPADLAGAGRLGLAVAEPVPFREYPLPTPPAVLQPLDPDLPPAVPGTPPAPDRITIRSDPADPNRPQQATVTWAHGLAALARSQTPGVLHLSVDGAPVELWPGRLAVWDYAQEPVGMNLIVGEPGAPEPGAEVTLTVSPEHMSGDWVVAIDQLAAEPGE